METKYTVADLKNKLIAHLMEMDLQQLPLEKLGIYASVLCTVKNLEEKSYAEVFQESAKNWCYTR